MLEGLWDLVQGVLGIGKDDLNAGEMTVRVVLTFLITVTIVRLGDKRMFGKGTAFDTVVAIMIGSIMSRAITGQSPLVATWVAGIVLVGMHWLLAYLSYRISWLGPFFKGTPRMLIKDGEVLKDEARKGAVTANDLEQALHAEGETDTSNVELAYLERDGSISIIPRKPEPRILDVSVENGVQTVRIALD